MNVCGCGVLEMSLHTDLSVVIGMGKLNTVKLNKDKTNKEMLADSKVKILIVCIFYIA